jgi:hypothetical protein
MQKKGGESNPLWGAAALRGAGKPRRSGSAAFCNGKDVEMGAAPGKVRHAIANHFNR